MLRRLRDLITVQRPGTSLRCSFCGRSDQEATKLVAGPYHSAICNDCVQECSKLVELDLCPPLDRSISADEKMAEWGELLARTAIRIARSGEDSDDSNYAVRIKMITDHFNRIVGDLKKREEP